MKGAEVGHAPRQASARLARRSVGYRAFVRRCAALLLACTSIACAGAPSAELRAPRTAAWRAARARLAALEVRARGGAPRTQRISLELTEPFTGRRLVSRGAVALSPPDALRMILLGPGGTTAMDLWIRGDRFRMAIPALDLLRRGDGSTPRGSMRGLPVDFLRWWLLAPMSGSLLWYERRERADRFVIRASGGAVVDVSIDDGGTLHASRRGLGGAEESVVAEGLGCAPARYLHAQSGLAIAIRCEGEDARPPSPRAFVDPDAPEAP